MNGRERQRNITVRKILEGSIFQGMEWDLMMTTRWKWKCDDEMMEIKTCGQMPKNRMKRMEEWKRRFMIDFESMKNFSLFKKCSLLDLEAASVFKLLLLSME